MAAPPGLSIRTTMALIVSSSRAARISRRHRRGTNDLTADYVVPAPAKRDHARRVNHGDPRTTLQAHCGRVEPPVVRVVQTRGLCVSRIQFGHELVLIPEPVDQPLGHCLVWHERARIDGTPHRGLAHLAPFDDGTHELLVEVSVQRLRTSRDAPE